MNYIPVVLVLFLLLFKSDNAKNILKELSPNDLQEILNFLGIDKQTATAVISLLPLLQKGKLDINQIIKVGAPLVFSMLNKANNSASPPTNSDNPLQELNGIASEQVINSLKEYFA